MLDNHDNVYGAVIMAEPLREFTRFMNVERRQAAADPRPSQTTYAVSPPVQAARNYTHHRHLLLLLVLPPSYLPVIVCISKHVNLIVINVLCMVTF